MERLHILDGYGYIFRAYFALLGGADRRAVRLSTSGGMPTGALYVYAQMLIRLYLDEKPDRIAVVFDAPGKTFRNELDGEYKATRRETPEELRVQMPYFRELTEAFCWPVIAVPGVEADDVIATMVKKARAQEWDVVLYSGDKDLMQLVDGHVVQVDSMRQLQYDAAQVEKKFGVGPAQVGDWLALVGDKIDNIPGMPGVGKVTATKLLEQFGSIDGILANVEALKGKLKERFSDSEQRAQLELSRQLVQLRDDVELPCTLESLVPTPWDGERLTKLFHELEFHALLARLDPGAAAPSQDAQEVRAPAAIEVPAARVVLDASELEAVVVAARQAKRVALQVETDGGRHDRARVVGIALAFADEPPVYVPLGHRYLSAPAQLELSALPAAFALLLADPSVAKVVHDAKTARKALLDAGLELCGVVGDTMLETYLIDANRDAYAFERVMASATGLTLPKRAELLGKGKNAIGFEAVPVERAAEYAGMAAIAVLRADAELTARMGRAQVRHLHDELEVPLAVVLSDIERTGITIDVDYLRGLADQLGSEIAAIESRVFELAGEPLNLGSPKQLAVLLFDKLGLTSEKMKKTKTGYSTDHEVLESLASHHEVVRPILEHRELIKLKGTYIDALPPLVNPRTGRLHTTFAQAVAATGRLSSQDPNLQNIPIRTELGRKIRRAFVAAEGRLLVSLDYSQIELRIMAHLSGDPVLTSAFRRGVDVHTQTAAEVFGISLEEVGGAERRVAKAVNYGLIYGQSPFGLARALDIPRSEAQHYIDRYFERFVTVRSFMDELVERARADGVATTMLGRKRPIPELAAKNYGRRRAAERIAQNTPMQGSAADIMKLAMLKASRRLERGDLDAKILLTVHDELVFEVERSQAEELGRVMQAEMAAALELAVPLVVDVGSGETWAEAH